MGRYAAERPDDLTEWPDVSPMLEVHGQLGTLAARQGNWAEAERISAMLEALQRPYLFGEHTYWRARIAALLGEPDRAVALLRAAYAQGFKWWLSLHSEPDLESLRDYPPFRELLRPKGGMTAEPPDHMTGRFKWSRRESNPRPRMDPSARLHA